MRCPFCDSNDTNVLQTRFHEQDKKVRRRRQCHDCLERFNTVEMADLSLPRVAKSDQSYERFDETKLRMGLIKALEKRPVESERIEQAIQNIKHELSKLSEKEVSSKFIGEYVMNELRQIDEVAYIRFASVYRSFQDVDEFTSEIKKLLNKNKKH